MPRADSIRYEDIAKDLRKHYEATGARDLREYGYRVKHLDRFFTGRRVNSIDQTEVNAYIVHRHGQGAADPTIRRELGTLTRMLRLAYENGKLLRMPIVHKPKDGAAREGSSSAISTTPSESSCSPISNSRRQSPIRSAGGCSRRCSCSSAGRSI